MHDKKSLTAPILAFVVLTMIAASRFLDISAMQNYDRDNVYLTMIVVQLLIFVLPGIFYCKLRGQALTDGLRLRLPSPGRLGIAAILLLTMITGGFVIKLLLSHLTGIPYLSVNALNFRATLSASGPSTLTDALYTITTFALVPALTQEYLFRGVLTAEYRISSYGTFSMVIIPSLLYALTAASPISLPVCFFEGILLSFSLLLTDSLLIPFISVFLKNIVELFFEDKLLLLVGQSEYFSLLLFLFGGLFLLLAVFAFHEAERLTYNEAVTGQPEPPYRLKDGKNRSALLECVFSPTLLLCVAVYIITILLQHYL